MMSKSKKKIKKKKRIRQQKENIEKKNINRIQEVKKEDNIKRNTKKAKRAKERAERAKKDKNIDLYREEININGEDLLKDVSGLEEVIDKIDSKEDSKEKSNKTKKNKKREKRKRDSQPKERKGEYQTEKSRGDYQTKKSRGDYQSPAKKEISPEKRKKLKLVANTIIGCFLIVLLILVYLALRPKFKDITIELGTTELSAENFLVSSIYKNGASIDTDLETIDLLEVQEVDITLDFKGKQETVKLNIVDTTAPTVVFKDMMGYLDYVPNPDDFIESKEDFSEMTVEIIDVPEYTDYGTYDVTVKVSDAYGNETVGKCELMITWLIQEADIELGSEFSVANVVIDVERFGDLVPAEELAKVDTMVLGTYEINVEIEGKVYTCKVVVQDTTPPDLVLQDITIWDDQTVSSWENFVVSATDISGEVTTECLTEMTFGTAGTQSITIRATDVNGNVNEQVATLTIQHDSTGPVIYGLTNLTVNKYASINYESGVYAIDNKDGSSSFSVNSSGVNTSAAGTYYATYSATDLSGNTSTYKRKITVNWDQSDVNQKVADFYNAYCAGQSAYGITSVVYSRIKYTSASYGGKSAAIYYGLTNGSGNCFVHAYVLQALINKSGSSCALIWLSDGAHCWNKVGSIHYDSTPGGRHLLQANSDEEKLSESWFAGKSYTAENFVISY